MESMPIPCWMLFAPINMRALFTGGVLDDDYCRTIAELVWRAVTPSKDMGNCRF
ncbi:MAG: hypothetical protein QOH91_399 [Mycobacterium sp.]|nr:hypothetical protein [Mycobacterium sp.]